MPKLGFTMIKNNPNNFICQGCGKDHLKYSIVRAIIINQTINIPFPKVKTRIL